MAGNSAGGYRSPSALVLGVTLLFVAVAVTHALTALSLIGQIQLLDAMRFGAAIPSAQAEAHDARQQLLGWLELGLGLPAWLLFLTWMYRVSRNARALGVGDLSYSPAWSVGWFFVPIANLFMPYRVLKELWQASGPPAAGSWRRAAVSPVVGTWWVVCLAEGVIHYSPWQVVTGRWRLNDIVHFNPVWLDGYWEFSWGMLIAEVVGIAADVLTVALVVGLTNLQERTYAANTS